MDATDNPEAPEVKPEAQERDTNADYMELMRKQQDMAVDLELQALASRNSAVANLIAERDALRARLADMQSEQPKRKARP